MDASARSKYTMEVKLVSSLKGPGVAHRLAFPLVEARFKILTFVQARTEGTFVCACASRNKRVVHESRDCRGNPNIGGNFKVQFVNIYFKLTIYTLCQIFTSVKTTFIHGETI